MNSTDTETKVYTLFSSLHQHTMGTRSRIGLQLADDSILSVYHHWDGYPAWLGKTLKAQYNTKEKVAELIDGGDMSSCWSDSIWGQQLPEGTFAPEYYADRGEDCPPALSSDLNDFFSIGEEYSYVFTSAGWVCYDMNQFNDKDPEVTAIPSN